jgi:hypothetical protein
VKQQQMTLFIRRVGILRELLPASLLEQVKKNESEWLWVEEIIRELELIVDSYEQPRASPTDYQEQKKSYEGIAKNTYIKKSTKSPPVARINSKCSRRKWSKK